MPPPEKEKQSALRHLDTAAALLDDRFRIPGTNIRFGLDFLIGLVPVAGDVVSFGLSGLLVIAMARHGASGMVVVKMLGNILLDAVVGSIPLFGDLFDLTYRANRRNLNLLREHYAEGRHRGSAWPIVIGVAFILFLLLALLVYGLWEAISWLVGAG